MEKIKTFATCAALVGLVALLAPKARSEPMPGLWVESTTSVDGARVRRIRDTGNGVVCYVATHVHSAPHLAISCVKL